ncbi:MAG: hypothetical protein ACK4WC_09935 [Rubrimonas sp.]
MTTRRLAAISAGLAAALWTQGAAAATPDFAFTFGNLSHGFGIVSGVVRGLTDNAAGAAASVEILGNENAFHECCLGVGEFVGNPDHNVWTVEDGQIASARFLAFGMRNAAPAVTEASLCIRFGFGPLELQGVGLSNFRGAAGAAPDTQNFLTFTRLEPTPAGPPAPVPLPAAGSMLLAAGGLLAALRRRRARG